MYSHERGGNKTGASNRYVKGRLPQGVDFAAYPGRSSTPLPTAESKSAERINQLKIWNEAATNVGTPKSKPGAISNANRRTDSFKDAKDRHSASFQEDGNGNTNGNGNGKHSTTTTRAKAVDIYANASSSDDDDEETENTNAHEEQDAAQYQYQYQQHQHHGEPNYNNNTNTDTNANTVPVPAVAVNENKQAAPPAIVPAAAAPAAEARPAEAPKESKGCCVIQ